MRLEEEYPLLKNPTKSEWRVIAVRSLILILLSILITAAAYIFNPKKGGGAKTGGAKNAASTRGGASQGAPDF